jgi:hypothetical protein
MGILPMNHPDGSGRRAGCALCGAFGRGFVRSSHEGRQINGAASKPLKPTNKTTPEAYEAAAYVIDTSNGAATAGAV